MKTTKILIVDDHEVVRDGLKNILTSLENITIAGEAGNGEDAVKMYSSLKPDLVIMDLLMPDQDGLEAIMTLRRDFPDTRVIAMTGASDTIGVLDLLDVAKMFGARRTLHKPFELNVLLDAVAAELTI